MFFDIGVRGLISFFYIKTIKLANQVKSTKKSHTNNPPVFGIRIWTTNVPIQEPTNGPVLVVNKTGRTQAVSIQMILVQKRNLDIIGVVWKSGPQ